MAMTEIICRCGCGRKKMVRMADVKRGWGKYYSKSCKAREQESRTHQHRNYLKKDNNYLNSGVSREKYLRYAENYGGIPQFSHSGEYEGFCDGTFDNTAHQNHDRT